MGPAFPSDDDRAGQRRELVTLTGAKDRGQSACYLWRRPLTWDVIPSGFWRIDCRRSLHYLLRKHTRQSVFSYTGRQYFLILAVNTDLFGFA